MCIVVFDKYTFSNKVKRGLHRLDGCSSCAKSSISSVVTRPSNFDMLLPTAINIFRISLIVISPIVSQIPPTRFDKCGIVVVITSFVVSVFRKFEDPII